MSDGILAAVAAAAGMGEAAPPALPAPPKLAALPAPDAPKFDAAAAATIAQMCATAGVPNMAAKLITENASVDEAKARISNAGAIRAAVDLARMARPSLDAKMADTFIAEGLSLEQVRSKLFETMVSTQSPEISGAVPAGGYPQAEVAGRRPTAKLDLAADMRRRCGIAA